MNLSVKGETLIKGYEKCRLKAYQDSKGVWTIGWGNTYYTNGKPVRQGDTIDQHYADILFREIASKFVGEVNYLVQGINLKQHQFDALVSFAYNLGSDIDADNIAEGLGDSTLLKLIKNNPEDPQISCEFLKWNKAGKKVLDGLTRRRKSEAYLYTTGEVNFFD